ncbi:MAG: glycolate oxidase subunit GlcE [Pseudomonadota bacterium]
MLSADTASHFAERIRTAAAEDRPLRIRGGGSKDFYGQSLEGEVLQTSGLAGVTSYEPSELVVTAGAGTPLAELEALLAAQGQCLPFEPPHFGGGATVGGLVASGLSGPARASSGAVRDYVLGVKFINGKGELLTFGGQVMKNVAGYDVSRLMTGAMGTLGLLVEVSLKVLPVALAENTLTFEMDEATALKQLNLWGAQPLPVNASCWHAGHLHVRLRGAAAAVSAARTAMGGEQQQDTALWQTLREQAHPFFALQRGESLWRMGLPDTAPPLPLGETLIEWGGAQRWLKLPAADVVRLRVAATAASGHATLFRAGEKSCDVFTPLAGPLARIHRSLKREFDPAGIFNRGRLYPGF